MMKTLSCVAGSAFTVPVDDERGWTARRAVEIVVAARRAVEIVVTARRAVEIARVARHGCSFSAACMTAFAMGAATLAPVASFSPPPFSTTTEIAIFGADAGANA